MAKKPVIHRITAIEGDSPAWCDSGLYTESGSRLWEKVTCKRCIRVGGEQVRDEIKAYRAEARYQKRRARERLSVQ